MQTQTQHRITTQALVCKAIHEPYILEDVVVSWDDERLTTQAIVEFEATGVCQTDLHLAEGVLPATFPFIGGHEGAGKILHLPRNYTGPLSIGDAVVATFKSCSSCPNCQDHRPWQCYHLFLGNFVVEPTIPASHPSIDNGVQLTLKTTGERVYGDFFGQSSFIKVGPVDLNCLVKVPPSHPPLDKLCAFGCGVQTGIGTVLNDLANPIERTFSHLPHWDKLSADLQANGVISKSRHQVSHQSIAIFGVGTVGCAAIIGARLAGCHTIIAVDVVDAKLDFAKNKAGATHTVNSSAFKDDPAGLIAHIRSLSPYGQGVNMSVEASGFPGVLDVALRSLVPGGRAASVGAGPQDITLDVKQHELLQNGWTLQGVFEGSSLPAVFLPYLIQLYAKGGDEWQVMQVSANAKRTCDQKLTFASVPVSRST